MIAGVVSFDQAWSPDGLASELAKASCRYPTLEARLILNHQCVVCYHIKRRDGDDKEIRAALSEDVEVMVIGEFACSKSKHQSLQNEIASQGITRLFDQSGLWIAVSYDREKGRCCLAVDPLGIAWVYIARFRQGYIFCSDFGALVSNYPESVNPDEETILATLAMGYTPDDKTCFREITVLPSGTLVELRAEGLYTVFRRSIEYGDRYASLSTQQKYDLLDGIYDKTAQDWFPDDSARFVVSFSGGYDSRYGLAMLSKRNIPAPCRIFGNPRNRDVRSARETCEQLNFEASIYEINQTSWEGWKRCVEQLGAAGGFHQGAGWAEEWLGMLRKTGTRVLIGFLGDALSGKHLVSSSPEKGKWLENWERWSLEEGWDGSSLLRPEARKLMRSCVRQRLEKASREASYEFPHQVAMHLDWYGRQRRFVASQPNIIARFLSPVAYFYTCYGMDFWSNVAMEDLENQRLYLSYAANRFPSLFYEPKPATVPERVWGAGKNVLIGLLPNAKKFIAPREVDNQMLIMQQRNHFVSLVEEIAPMVENIVDTRNLLEEIRTFPKNTQVTAPQLLCFVNLAILLKLSFRSN